MRCLLQSTAAVAVIWEGISALDRYLNWPTDRDSHRRGEFCKSEHFSEFNKA